VSVKTSRTTNAQSAKGSSLTELGSDGQFRLLVDGVTDYAIIALDPKGIVTTWNQGAERIKGYKADEIIGKHFSCFYPQDKIQAGFPEQELRAAEKDGRFEDEGWRVRKDGEQFQANVIVTALRDEQGKLIGFGKMTRDLTAQKRAEETIAQQSQEILDISTPVIQVWDGVLAAPLIGTLDSGRTQQFMERLLHRIVETNSPVALVDITGVPTIDTETAQHLIETVTAVRMLGAQVVLTGVRPALAQTLVHLGTDLSGILTRSSMSSGLRVALELLGLHVVSKNGRG
jgi:PAS domain S-box-containing protein